MKNNRITTLLSLALSALSYLVIFPSLSESATETRLAQMLLKRLSVALYFSQLIFQPDIWQIRSFAHWKSCKIYKFETKIKMKTLSEFSLTTALMFVQQYSTHYTLCLLRLCWCLSVFGIIHYLIRIILYDLVWQVSIIVQIKESLEIEDEFIFLELREGCAVLTLFENLNISHPDDQLVTDCCRCGRGGDQRLLCSLTPVLWPGTWELELCDASLALGGGQLSPLEHYITYHLHSSSLSITTSEYYYLLN